MNWFQEIENEHFVINDKVLEKKRIISIQHKKKLGNF